MKVTAIKPEEKETAKRLQGVVKSLIRTGFINAKEVPATLSIDEARNLINNVVNGGKS